jgi:hypothetical protein
VSHNLFSFKISNIQWCIGDVVIKWPNGVQMVWISQWIVAKLVSLSSPSGAPLQQEMKWTFGSQVRY